MPAYDTLSMAVNDLHKRGYTIDFRLHPHGLQDEVSGDYLSPDKFEIAEFYRFEGDSNPDDASIVYAITSDNGEIRGILISAFGMYSDITSEKMLEKLHFKQ